MRIDLAVPYRDTAAADLLVAVRPGLQAPDGLVTLHARAGALELQLRVLGASHAVVARAPGGASLTEIVACGAPAGLPLASSEGIVGGLRHVLRCEVLSLAEHAAAVHALSGERDAVVAAFPGAADAVTAIRALPSGWESWHLYPATGEAVRTTTTIGAV